jgi:hypothetical protein
MTGYKSKRAAAQDKLKCQCSLSTKLVGSGCQYCNSEYMDDDDVQPEQASTNELHTCPYAEEIHGNYAKLCDCDREATRQCKLSI